LGRGPKQQALGKLPFGNSNFGQNLVKEEVVRKPSEGRSNE
jgi:hypothetical protein